MQPHPWDVSISEARAIQESLRSSVIVRPLKKEPRLIAGADISFGRFSDIFFAGVVVLTLPDLRVVEYALHTMRVSFPYVPGYLSFREVPAIAEAYRKLKHKPDVIVMDGHGIAHPRGLGVASHLGLVLDIPSIGCAKRVLYGEGEEPGEAAGSTAFLHESKAGFVIGARLRTKRRAKPVIVSAGHKVNLEDALSLMQRTVRGYRIPEPTRLAHDLVNQFRRGEIHA